MNPNEGTLSTLSIIYCMVTVLSGGGSLTSHLLPSFSEMVLFLSTISTLVAGERRSTNVRFASLKGENEPFYSLLAEATTCLGLNGYGLD